MLPPVDKFVSRVRAMGIGDGHRVVVYDQDGLFSAARVWWMFRVFGHDDVAVLDGGLKKWIAEGREVDDLPPAPRERHFTARKDASNRTAASKFSKHRSNLSSKSRVSCAST